MTDPIQITVDEFEKHMEFCVEMCDRNNVVWRIERPDGSAVMCVPVKTVKPQPLELQQEIEKFAKQFRDED